MTKVQRISHIINSLSTWKLWLFAFAPRLTWWLLVVLFGDASFSMYDSAQFELLASNLLEYGEFSRSVEAPFFPDIARTPGYPVFLMPFFASGASSAIIALFQSVFAAGVPVLIFKAAQRLNLSSPYLAFGIVALDLSLILFMPLILSDGLFVLLLSFLLYILAKDQLHSATFLGSGILLGVLILVRPIALFLPLVFLVYLIGKRIPMKGLTLFVLGTIVLPFGWLIRNHHHFNTLTLSSMSSNNLLLYNAANIHAKNEMISFAEAQHQLGNEALHSVDWENDSIASKKYISHCQKRAFEIISESPFTMFEQMIHSVAFYFFKPPRSYFDKVFELDYAYAPIDGLGETNSLLTRIQSTIGKSSLLSVILALITLLFNIFTVFLAFQGARILLKKHPQLAFLLIGGALYFCFFSVFTATDARFRLPAVPFLALLVSAFPIRTRSKNLRY